MLARVKGISIGTKYVYCADYNAFTEMLSMLGAKYELIGDPTFLGRRIGIIVVDEDSIYLYEFLEKYKKYEEVLKKHGKIKIGDWYEVLKFGELIIKVTLHPWWKKKLTELLTNKYKDEHEY